MSRARTLLVAPRRTLLVAIAGVAAVILALALVVEPPARDQAGEAGSAPSTSSAGQVMAEPAARGGAAPADAATELEPSEPAGAAAEADMASPTIEPTLDAPSLHARIIRTASIDLRLRDGRFEAGWGDAQAVAGASGGYVVSASRSGAGDGPRFGTITMRVPTEKFDAAVDRLRELSGAKVARLDVSSQDVTQEFVDVRSRLRHDRAVEGRLLALLAKTEGVSEVLAVQARLDQVQEQIEVSRGRLQYLEKLTSMSTIQLSLREPGGKAGERNDPEASVLAHAWRDAGERFAANVAGGIVWLGGALPALFLLAVLVAVSRVAWRRRVRTEDPARSSDSTI